MTTIKFTVCPHFVFVKGQDGVKHRGHLKDFQLGFSVFIQEVWSEIAYTGVWWMGGDGGRSAAYRSFAYVTSLHGKVHTMEWRTLREASGRCLGLGPVVLAKANSCCSRKGG